MRCLLLAAAMTDIVSLLRLSSTRDVTDFLDVAAVFIGVLAAAAAAAAAVVVSCESLLPLLCVPVSRLVSCPQTASFISISSVAIIAVMFAVMLIVSVVIVIVTVIIIIIIIIIIIVIGIIIAVFISVVIVRFNETVLGYLLAQPLPSAYCCRHCYCYLL